jgi:hypothetical protein
MLTERMTTALYHDLYYRMNKGHRCFYDESEAIVVSHFLKDILQDTTSTFKWKPL